MLKENKIKDQMLTELAQEQMWAENGISKSEHSSEGGNTQNVDCPVSGQL